DLVGSRVVDDTEHALAPLRQADRHAEAGVIADEVVGTVDGVDDPHWRLGVELGEALLAQQPERRIGLLECLSYALLRLEVDEGNYVTRRRLDAHPEVGAASVVVDLLPPRPPAHL